MRLRAVGTSSLVTLLFAALFAVGGAWLWADEFRTWTDATGKFTISAELVEEKEGKVVLRKKDGVEVTLSIDRLSAKDQKYLASQRAGASEATKERTGAINDAKDGPRLRLIAEEFYGDLRTEQRTVARGHLTEDAQSLVDESASALTYLPTPDESAKAIRVGKAKVTKNTATISVVMVVKGEPLRTTLHLRKTDEQWQVFGMSAKLRGEEVTVNLETRFELPQLTKPDDQPQDPLDSLVGKPIELTGITLDGRAVSLSQFKGKVVLIDFWATWCGPCRAEMPNIAANYQRFKKSGFEVIAVSLDKDMDELAQFVVQENPPWIVLADSHPANSTRMAAKFPIRGIPAFVLVGKDGKVAAVNCRGEKLGEALSALLQ